MTDDNETPDDAEVPDGVDETHPAYGMVGFSRISMGGGKSGFLNFFGSDLDNHMSCVRLKISTAARRRGTGQYYYHGTGRIIDVDLTAAQFAELLTTQNVGDGVPCTIRYRDGVAVPYAPSAQTSAARSQSDFEKKTRNVVKDAKRLLDRVEVMAGEKSITKSSVRDVAKELRRVIQDIESNMPFVMETFREAITDVVQKAKAEVDAFVTNAVATAGVTALAGRNPMQPHLLPGNREVVDPPEDGK